MTHPLITRNHIDTYQKDGVVLVKGLFKDYIEPLRKGIATNMAEPIPRAMVFVKAWKSARAASELITGNIAVASDMPRTPSGN